MADTKNLLSQSEIDALVAFLKKQQDVSIGRVLDQNSIDKLIEIVQTNNSKGIYFDNEGEKLLVPENIVVIDEKNGEAMNPSECVLEAREGENGFVDICCVQKATGAVCRISPSFFLQKPEDGTTWGFAVSPRTFEDIAEKLGITYTSEEYEAVCKRFSKVMYGTEDAVIAEVY